MTDEEKTEGDVKEKVKSKYIVRTPIDLQRIKLEKLMEHPEKPVAIPITNKQKKFMSAIPTFVRNVMGSSAGAGSGEFHVYRHLRRKEYARQKYIQHKSKQETLDEEYQQKIEQNRINSEEKTSKKRAKRLKKKQNYKNNKKTSKPIEVQNEDEEMDEDEDEDDEINTMNSDSEDNANIKLDVVLEKEKVCENTKSDSVGENENQSYKDHEIDHHNVDTVCDQPSKAEQEIDKQISSENENTNAERDQHVEVMNENHMFSQQFAKYKR